jgi:hypothetical protein
MIKLAFIRKLPNGKYRVLSRKGKNLGTYDSKEQASKRLKQIEFFKHIKASEIIDLTDIYDFSLSAILREINKQNKNALKQFLKIYNERFNFNLINKYENAERLSLLETLVEFKKSYQLKLDKEMVKNASISRLESAEIVGKYLSDIIKFIIGRISPISQPKVLMNLKRKIYNLDANDLANKGLPNSAAIGQSITFVKNVLFNHDPSYIRKVINNIVRNL